MRRKRERRSRALGFALAALAATVSAPPAGAAEWYRDGDRYVDASGSLRALFTVTNGTEGDRFAAAIVANGCLTPARFADCPAFDLVGDRDVWQSLMRLRMKLEAGFGDGWSGELVYDLEWQAGVLDGLFAEPGAVEDSFLGLEDGLGESTRHHAQAHRVYRGWLRFEEGPLRITVGRQRIPWGVGRLWNPIDRFNAIGPLALEADQSLGIDAVDVRWSFSGFDQLQFVYAPATRSADARYAARLQAVIRDVDVGVMVGRFEQAFTTGFDLAGNLGDAAWRIEAVWTDPARRVSTLEGAASPSAVLPALGPLVSPSREVDRFWQAIVSIDYNFDLGTGLYVLVEHLWDQNALGLGPRGRGAGLIPFFQAPGVPVSPDRFGGSRVVSLVSHQTGVMLGYELSSAVSGNLLVLWDWRGASAVLAPSLTFTGFNAVELSLAAQLFSGADRSQYGRQEALLYALLEWFF